MLQFLSSHQLARNCCNPAQPLWFHGAVVPPVFHPRRNPVMQKTRNRQRLTRLLAQVSVATRIASATLSLLFVANAVPAAAQATTGRTTISGLVTDVVTGQPVVGVTVSVFGTPHAASTNEQGRYSIPNVPTGNTITL